MPTVGGALAAVSRSFWMLAGFTTPGAADAAAAAAGFFAIPIDGGAAPTLAAPPAFFAGSRFSSGTCV